MGRQKIIIIINKKQSYEWTPFWLIWCDETTTSMTIWSSQYTFDTLFCYHCFITSSSSTSHPSNASLLYTSWHNFGLHVCKVVFRSSVFIPPLVQDIWMCIKTLNPKPSLPQNLHATKYGRGTSRVSVHCHVLEICMRIQVTSFFPSYLCKIAFGYMFPHGNEIWVCILSEKSSLRLYLGEITRVRMWLG
jgi:hypothetical protein